MAEDRVAQPSLARSGPHGQRHPAAPTALPDLDARMDHRPNPGGLLAHLRDRYGIEPAGASRLSIHKGYVFRVDRRDGDPWVARAFPPARPRAGATGDAALLRFLATQDYPAERLAADDPVSDLDGSAVLVTRFATGAALPYGPAKFALLGELLGRLHALPPDESSSRPGGASGEDPRHEGAPRQDLLAALAFLDAVEDQVTASERARFERLRATVRSADDGDGLPEALVHGNLLHAPDHALVGDAGPVVINWKSAGRGPRLTDLAAVLWGTGTWRPRALNAACLEAAVRAYRRHTEPNAAELDRLEGLLSLRALYLVCYGYRRAVEQGVPFREWGFVRPPEYFHEVASAARRAFGQRP